MALRGVATTMLVEESVRFSVMAADLDVSKLQLVRGVLRFALSRNGELRKWLIDHKTEWVSY